LDAEAFDLFGTFVAAPSYGGAGASPWKFLQ